MSLRKPHVPRALLCLALSVRCGGEPVETGGSPAEQKETSSGCAPGEVSHEGGGCRPAGLPPDLGPCKPGELSVDGGGCLAAGLPSSPEGCAPGELEKDGDCHPAGVPVCPEGFTSDGLGGCSAVLPKSCPEGLMALPGEAKCRPVMPCANGVFPAIPPEDAALAEYVDAGFVGASEGSEAKPWSTIAEAIEAAADGAVIAVAAGSYEGDLVVEGKSVRILGVCPEAVEVVGVGAGPSGVALLVRGSGGPQADGTEARGISIRGPNAAIGVFGAQDVLFDGVHVHDTGWTAVYVDQSEAGRPAGVTLRGALIEKAAGRGAAVFGSALVLADGVVRGVKAATSLYAVYADEGATLEASGSVLEDNEGFGLVLSGGAQATLERLVVRRTRVVASKETKTGIGIYAQASSVDLSGCALEDDERAALVLDDASEAAVASSTVRGAPYLGISIRESTLALAASAVVGCGNAGLGLTGASAVLEGVVVRDTSVGWFEEHEEPGGGLYVEDSALSLLGSSIRDNAGIGLTVRASGVTVDSTEIADTHPSSLDPGSGAGVVVGFGGEGLTLARSDVLRNTHAGVYVVNARAVIESTRIAGTEPSDVLWADGVDVWADPATGDPAEVDIRHSLVSGNRRLGVFVQGARVSLEACIVEGPEDEPDHPDLGLGVAAQLDPDTGSRARMDVLGSVVRRSRTAGVMGFGADLVLDSSRVEDTRPKAGTETYGVGLIAAAWADAGSVAHVRRSLVQGSHGAGIAVGSSEALIESTTVDGTKGLPVDPFGGMGIVFTRDAGGPPALGTVLSSVVSGSRVAGVGVFGSDVIVEGTAIVATAPDLSHGKFGDGVLVAALGGVRGKVALVRSRVESSARSGVGSFGSDVSYEALSIACTAFDMNGETWGELASSFETTGESACRCDNRSDAAGACECDESARECHVATASLEPPPPPPPPDPVAGMP